MSCRSHDTWSIFAKDIRFDYEKPSKRFFTKNVDKELNDFLAWVRFRGSRFVFPLLANQKNYRQVFSLEHPTLKNCSLPKNCGHLLGFWLMRCRMGGIQISELNFKKQPTEKVTSVGIRASNTGSDVDLDGKPD